MPGTAVVESALCLFGSGSPTEALIGSPRDSFGCIWDTKSFWADGEQCHLELPVHGDTGSFILGGEKPDLPQGNKLCGADAFSWSASVQTCSLFRLCEAVW